MKYRVAKRHPFPTAMPSTEWLELNKPKHPEFGETKLGQRRNLIDRPGEKMRRIAEILHCGLGGVLVRSAGQDALRCDDITLQNLRWFSMKIMKRRSG